MDTESRKSSDLNVEKASNDSAELVERGNWGKPLEFILACLNYALGLGNVWRFPYLCFRNGGGAFLVPYLLMVFVIGLPIFFAELVIGQYSALGPIQAFGFISPLFKGLGYCTLLVTSFVSIYYMVIIAWVLYYIWTSFFPSLIWGSCDNKWNSENCYSIVQDIKCQANNVGNVFDELFFQGECRSAQSVCSTYGLEGLNVDSCVNRSTSSDEIVPISDVVKRKLAAEEFFYENVLGLGDAEWTSGWGYPQWHLVLCLAIAWSLAFFCVIKGIKSVGKIVYFTATFPYVILTALLVRALTLDGAADGIWFYITPEWALLKSAGVWGDASSQIFYSFGLGWGSLVVLASYNKFRNNCHFDAVLVSLVNFGTAVYSGFVVFAILGFLSKSMNVPIDAVTTSGPGLTFITYPEAVLLMPLPQLWALLFFFMMLILGLGTMFGSIQMVTTTIVDHWPHLRDKEWRATAGTCIGGFIAALPMTCNGGIYLFTLMEWHTASWAILLIGLAEIVVLSWVYGMDLVLDNISEMGMKLGRWTKIYWKSVWLAITPILLVAVFIFILTDLSASEFRGYVFPVWATVLGWMFGLATLLPLFIAAVVELAKKKNNFKDLLKPTLQWGPQEVDGQRVDRSKL